MNFKQAYKAANDEIHGDKSILAGLSEKETKTPIIYLKPVFTLGVAAAIALVTWVSYPYLNTNTLRSQEEITLNSEVTDSLRVTEKQAESSSPSFTAKETAVPEIEEDSAAEVFSTEEATNSSVYESETVRSVAPSVSSKNIDAGIATASADLAVAAHSPQEEQAGGGSSARAYDPSYEEEPETESTHPSNEKARIFTAEEKSSYYVTVISINEGASALCVSTQEEEILELIITEETVITSPTGDILTEGEITAG